MIGFGGERLVVHLPRTQTATIEPIKNDVLRSHEMTPASHNAACEEVARYAIERNKEFSGYKVLTGFMSNETLLAAFSDVKADGTLSGRQQARAIVEYLEESEKVTMIIAELLRFISADPSQEAYDTATRILSQIRADLDASDGRAYRKPVHYVAAADEGLAVAIVIDDRFWTEEW